MLHHPRTLRSLRVLFDFLLILLIGAVLSGVVLGRILPMLGHQTLVVSGGSMEPAIPRGSIVVLSVVPADEVARGDVITLRHPDSGTIITHRVTEIAELPAGMHFQTRGDANAEPEGALSPATWMLGRVWFSVPFAGYLVQLMIIPSGVVFLLCLAGLLVAVLWTLEDLADERARRASTRASMRASTRAAVGSPGRAESRTVEQAPLDAGVDRGLDGV